MLQQKFAFENKQSDFLLDLQKLESAPFSRLSISFNEKRYYIFKQNIVYRGVDA